MADTARPDLAVHAHDGWTEITLSAPMRRNALRVAMVTALRDALRATSADPACRVLMLSGEGTVFCAGMDLKTLGPDGSDTDRAAFPGLWDEVHNALFEAPMPIVVALEGGAINAGAALALAGDLLVAARTGFVQTGEAQQDMPIPRNVAWLVLRHGEATAMRFVLLGDRVAADDLLRLGIAFEVVDTGTVRSAAAAVARRLAGFPGTGLRRAKAAVRRSRTKAAAADWFAPALQADPGRVFAAQQVT